MKNEKLIKKYDKQVKMYEKNLNNPTLSKWRSKLVSNAKGNVLEVGVGVGANFPYYNKDDVFVTGVDFSSEMIKSAKRTAAHYQINTEFVKEDVERLNFEPNSFDCIVSTLSLCSYKNPIQILNNFNRWCKRDGIILFMEHGISSNNFLSLTQKIVDPLFHKIEGCHCNRDISGLVKSSNLQVEKIETYWAGILYLLWAKPSK